MSLVSELKRRNVFRVGIAYAVIGWLLLQITDVLVPILELPDWVARLVLFLLVLGLPLVLVFSWAYELTPEGIKREHEVDRSRSITRQTGHKLDRTIIAVLTVALAWFAWDRFRAPPRVTQETIAGQTAPDTADDPACEASLVVAMLPFKATGSDDGGFLATGLHDDLLTLLAKLDAYQVISRTSMVDYVGTTKNMRQIGEELGASHILEGGVQARGKRIRINAQLIDAANDEHLWAETYDRELTASDLTERARDRAGELLETYGADPDQAASVNYSVLKRVYHSARGDAAETRHWIEEHRRRLRSQTKGDHLNAVQEHLWYAFELSEVGLYEDAVAELRVMLEEPGGYRFPFADVILVFEELQDHPEYVALREQFGE